MGVPCWVLAMLVRKIPVLGSSCPPAGHRGCKSRHVNLDTLMTKRELLLFSAFKAPSYFICKFLFSGSIFLKLDSALSIKEKNIWGNLPACAIHILINTVVTVSILKFILGPVR